MITMRNCDLCDIRSEIREIRRKLEAWHRATEANSKSQGHIHQQIKFLRNNCSFKKDKQKAEIEAAESRRKDEEEVIELRRQLEAKELRLQRREAKTIDVAEYGALQITVAADSEVNLYFFFVFFYCQIYPLNKEACRMNGDLMRI